MTAEEIANKVSSGALPVYEIELMILRYMEEQRNKVLEAVEDDRVKFRAERDAALLQVNALRELLIARHAIEPKHSREDHDCLECMALSDTRPSEKQSHEKPTCTCTLIPMNAISINPACEVHKPYKSEGERKDGE